MNSYLLSQLFVITATILLGITYFAKKKKNILILCVLYCIFYGLHYLLLNAITGALMTLISLIRNYWFYINSKKNRENSKLILITLILIAIISGVMGYQDIFSIVSIFASITSTYSIWQDNIKIYRFLAVPVSLCFLIYAIHINSVIAIFTEIILLIMEIIGIISLYLNNKNIYS
ncbi:MAG: YgjV family protein [Bacilli bacterium]|nr:YgjV family protein [Bacilli bacterium]